MNTQQHKNSLFQSSRTLGLSILGSTLIASTALCDVTVTGVAARQHWPWDNKVDVDFTLDGTDGDQFYYVDILAKYPGMAGDGVRAKTLLSEPVIRGNAAHRIVWDMGADLPGLYTTNMTVSVTVTPFGETTPAYVVIDISGGSTATNYPVRYTTVAPDLSQDTCRTTELWLKRCPAGTFTMGEGTTANSDLRYPAHTVKLTQPYYIGVFEVTQEQYYRVMGTKPSVYSNATCWATRPVENIRWYDMRHSYHPGEYAPSEDTPPTGYFMSNLRIRSGLKTLDLPTEAQWEHACRGGTTENSYYPAGSVTDYVRGPWTVDGVGIHVALYDCDTRWGTAKVGSYPPNPWGLYDMNGNVQEVVYDFGPVDSATQIEEDINAGKFENTPENLVAYFTDPWCWPDRESNTVVTTRGGSFVHQETMFYSYSRSRVAINENGKSRHTGFRVAMTVR